MHGNMNVKHLIILKEHDFKIVRVFWEGGGGS